MLSVRFNRSIFISQTWDDELAKLAEYNAKSCTYGHDQCRNTATYKYAGQNIAIVMSTPNYFETIKAIDYLFGLWFDEYKDCDMTYINKYRPSDTKYVFDELNCFLVSNFQFFFYFFAESKSVTSHKLCRLVLTKWDAR